MTRLSIVAPCYNEADAIPFFIRSVSEALANRPDLEVEYVFVDDGSADSTLEVLKRLQKENANIVIVELSRNFGKEAALSAGLAQATGDIVAPMDADLQDPPSLLPEMIDLWRQGYDVVLARRESRQSDSWLKRTTAAVFYKIFNALSPLRIPANVGDFRLMSRKAVQAVNGMTENCRFMKGVFAFVGFRTTFIDYVRPARSVGDSKFNFWKLLIFSLDGITGFSVAPLRLWGIIGFCLSLFAICLGSFYLIRTFIFGVDVPGYASLIVTVAFLGGIQILGIGLLGEYLGRAYMESKRRPPYIINEVYRREKRKREKCQIRVPRRKDPRTKRIRLKKAK